MFRTQIEISRINFCKMAKENNEQLKKIKTYIDSFTKENQKTESVDVEALKQLISQAAQSLMSEKPVDTLALKRLIDMGVSKDLKTRDMLIDLICNLAKNEDKRTELDIILSSKGLDSLLISKAAQRLTLEQTIDETALHLLISKGASLDYVVSGAAFAGHTKLVEDLINTHGASMYIATKAATEGKQVDLVNHLLEMRKAKLTLDLTQHAGMTHTASFKFSLDCAKAKSHDQFDTMIRNQRKDLVLSPSSRREETDGVFFHILEKHLLAPKPTKRF